MPDSTASFRINLESGEFAFSGSEEFVTKQIDENRDRIDQLLDKLTEKSVNDRVVSNREGGSTDDEAGNPYPNVFTTVEGEVRIIVDIPCESNKEGTEKTTLLYIYGKELLTGNGSASFKEIMEACKRQGCYNKSNHSSYVKSAGVVTVDGSGKSQKAELTVPGRKEAEKLAEELSNEEGVD